jgi:hypothetical protein
MIYLPVLLAAFIWQAALLLQRFLDLAIRPRFTIGAIGVVVVINLVMNMVFVPIYGLVASSLSLFCSALLYGGFVTVLAVNAVRRLTEE